MERKQPSPAESSDNQTLYDALVAEESHDQAALLTEQGKKITKGDIIAHMSGKNAIDISDGLDQAFMQIAQMRIALSLPVLPWPNKEIEARIEQEAASINRNSPGANILAETGGGAW